ncbi:hypothetical protein [Streptomyces noursei]
MTIYDGTHDIYGRVGLSKITFHKLIKGIWCPDPDIMIGNRLGWHRHRSERWLRETGRIDIHGNPSMSHRVGRPRKEEEPPRWYTTYTRRYLSPKEAAFVVGVERKAIDRLRRSGAGPTPSVAIGSFLGYDLDVIVRTGLHYGWIEPDRLECAYSRYQLVTGSLLRS